MAEKDAKELSAGSLLYIVGTIMFPTFLMFGPSGAAADQANLISFFFFAILGLSGFLVLLVKMILPLLGNQEYEGVDRYLTIHSPERTWVGQKFSSLQSPLNMFLVFNVVAMVVGSSISISGTFVSGVPSLVEGSISDSTSLALAVEPAVSAETLFFQFVLLMGQTAVFYTLLVKRGVSSFQSAVISKFIAVLTTTFFAFLYHSFRYDAAETAQGGVMVLFAVLNTVTALTNSIIPAYLIHGSSNFFAEATSEGIFSSEFAVVATVLIALLSVILLIVRLSGSGGRR